MKAQLLPVAQVTRHVCAEREGTGEVGLRGQMAGAAGLPGPGAGPSLLPRALDPRWPGQQLPVSPEGSRKPPQLLTRQSALRARPPLPLRVVGYPHMGPRGGPGNPEPIPTGGPRRGQRPDSWPGTPNAPARPRPPASGSPPSLHSCRHTPGWAS